MRLLAVAALALLLTAPAVAHLPANAGKPKRVWWTVQAQQRNLDHARYFCKHALLPENRRWHCKAVGWISRTQRATIWRAIAPWMPTYRCEHGTGGWFTNTGNGFYGGLQFDYDTWLRHGGRMFAARADLATPLEQVIVASRLTYDGWPNCPNP
jgi:hypothetical protein